MGLVLRLQRLQLCGELAVGLSLRLELPAPPQVTGVAGDEEATLSLAIGPLIARLQLPGLFVEPVALSAAAELEAALSIDARQQVTLQRVEVTRLILAAGEGLPAAPRARVEELLRAALSRILEEALAGAFPELPVPTLAIPAGFEDFELPPTLRLGLLRPTLSASETSWALSGDFGEVAR